jgi:uncharacterized membrane protein YkoI
MRRGSFIIGLLALGLAVTPAFGQYNSYSQGKPKAQAKRVISPSAAVKIALAQYPGAKALGVRLRSDNSYVVTLRLGSKVVREIVSGN